MKRCGTTKTIKTIKVTLENQAVQTSRFHGEMSKE